jgi:hypothetical protein
VTTDAGQLRLLDASYVSEHVEHAYALTGHGAYGATVEGAGVTYLADRPSKRFPRSAALISCAISRREGPNC